MKCIVNRNILKSETEIIVNKYNYVESIKCTYVCVCGTSVKSTWGITDLTPSQRCNNKFFRSNSEIDFNV